MKSNLILPTCFFIRNVREHWQQRNGKMTFRWTLRKHGWIEIISKQREHSLLRNKADVGKVHKVLIEGVSKRSEKFLQGRNTHNKVIVFPQEDFQKGEYVNVLVEECTGGTLVGKAVAVKCLKT